jgi:hypothetical protein
MNSMISESWNSSKGADPNLRFRASPDVVFNRLGDETVLIHLSTNRILKLNRTATRLWELICDGRSQSEIQQTMLDEFDVSEADISGGIEQLLTSLQSEQLIEPCAG